MDFTAGDNSGIQVAGAHRTISAKFQLAYLLRISRPCVAYKIDIFGCIGHIWPMLFTLNDQMADLGKRIKARRLSLDLTQQAAAAKAGVAHRTWRRMEAEGRASIEDLVRAAIALRCDEGIAALFPEMVANSMDELLKQQRKATKSLRQRATGTRP